MVAIATAATSTPTRKRPSERSLTLRPDDSGSFGDSSIPLLGSRYSHEALAQTPPAQLPPDQELPLHELPDHELPDQELPDHELPFHAPADQELPLA